MDQEDKATLERLNQTRPEQMNDLQLAKYIALLDARERDLKAKRKEIADIADEAKDVVLDRMIESGTAKISAAGKTLYIHRQEYARVRGKQHAKAVKVLQANGKQDLITLGTQKLSAFLRSNPLEDQPEDMQKMFGVWEKEEVRVRKS